MEAERRPHNFFEGTSVGLNGKKTKVLDPLEAMAQFKQSLNQTKASTASPAQRAHLADRLEAQGLYYDALVERLRCVDLLDSGPSRYKLANLYLLMGEKKMAFETLKEATENHWSSAERDDLIATHIMLGDVLFDSAKDALRKGDRIRIRGCEGGHRCLRSGGH